MSEPLRYTLYILHTRQAVCVWRHIELRSRYRCCSGEAISVTYCECVFVALGMQHAMRMRHIAICGLPRSNNTFPHYLINGTVFQEIKLLKTKCVFWFPVQLFSGTFLTLRRTERDVIKTVYRSLYKVPVFLSDFNESWILPTTFRKMRKYHVSWKSVQWEPSSLRTDGRTDMTKLVVVFRHIANAPKN
jgi:hypothetical protein